MFHKNLKKLKLSLRALNKIKYGDIPKRAREAFENLCTCQHRALTSPTAENFADVSAATATWNHYADIKEKFYWQKSRLNWLKCGDHNTAFFHRSTQARAAKNAIKRLITLDGTVLTMLPDIKQAVAGHFQEFLQARPDNIEEVPESFLSELLVYRCPADTASALVRDITPAEIKETLFSMPLNKAPGPDGYPVEFYRSAWAIIGKDFITAVQSFFIYGFMPHGVNATLLSLIPKKSDPESMMDYRPIACCQPFKRVATRAH